MQEYNKVISNLELEPLLVIPIFIHDFLCIHPFNDGNGRMSRLLTTLLLYRSNFFVAKYISLEAIMAKDKTAYYKALRQAGNGWHEGSENVLPFVKYLLKIILVAHQEFEDRLNMIEEKLQAMEIVRKAVLQKAENFTKEDIKELCPTLSVSSIEAALRKLTNQGEIRREGVSRATKYLRIK